jgi:hypothetical protein
VAETGDPGVPPALSPAFVSGRPSSLALHILVKRESRPGAGSANPPYPWHGHGAMPVLERGISASHGVNPVRRDGASAFILELSTERCLFLVEDTSGRSSIGNSANNACSTWTRARDPACMIKCESVASCSLRRCPALLVAVLHSQALIDKPSHVERSCRILWAARTTTTLRIPFLADAAAGNTRALCGPHPRNLIIKGKGKGPAESMALLTFYS